MARTDDRTEGQLPVTGEVGSEGGSFADPTVQVATFEGDVARSGRSERSTAGQAVRSEDTAGMVRYPTEPPHPPSATEGRRLGGVDWRAGLAGAAVGALMAMAFSRRRD